MTPEELNALVKRVEGNFRRDLVVSMKFNEFTTIMAVPWYIKMRMMSIRMVYMIFFIRSCFMTYAFLFLKRHSPSAVKIRYYCVDIFEGLGSLGCLLNTVYGVGFLLLLMHFKMFCTSEKKNNLHVLNHLKQSMEIDFTPQERKEFARVLEKMAVQGKYTFFLVTLALSLGNLYAAVVTGQSMKEKMSDQKIRALDKYVKHSIPVMIGYFMANYFGIQWLLYGHMITAHSVNYFRIRIKRIYNLLQDWREIEMIKRIITKETEEKKEGDEKEEEEPEPEPVVDLEKVLLELQSLFNEIAIHNKMVKVILRDIKTFMGIMCRVIIIFVVTRETNYVKKLILIVIVLCILTGTLMTLHNASQVYLDLRKISKELHSVQIMIERDSMTNMSQFYSLKMFVKKMIQWTSSDRLPLGLTVGDSGSLHPNRAGLFLPNTIKISLMILNARY